MKNKAVFLDRDGVINEEGPMEEHIFFEDLKIIPAAVSAVKAFNDMRYKIIVVTNQPAVARGLCSEGDVKETMEKLVAYFKGQGAVIDAYYFCPHHPEKKYGGNMAYRTECSCRKPKPGMLLQAAREHNINLHRSFMIGDTWRDTAAGKAAGCKTIILSNAHGNMGREKPDFIVNSITDAVKVVQVNSSGTNFPMEFTADIKSQRISASLGSRKIPIFRGFHALSAGMKAVIVAGGKGTRLRPLTCDIPKPMLPVAGKPIIHHQIELLKQSGFSDIVICTGYLGDQIKKYFGNGSCFGVTIEYSEEKKPLGTGGAIKNAERLIDGTFLIVYGDLMLGMNIKKLVTFHKSKNAMLTLVLHETNHPYDSDLVAVDENSRVAAIFHKPNKDPLPSKFSKTSVYVAEPGVLHAMPSGNHDFEKEIIPKLVEKGVVFGYITNEFVRDVGSPERLGEIEKMWLKRKSNN